MSYILEALKKAQRTRDRGQVPRLERVLRDPPPGAAAPPRRGLALALVLALAALAVALYAAWQVAAPVPAPPAREREAPDPVPPSAPSPPPSEPDATASAPPRVLVVPAPRTDGRPLPRGAEELRRAVLGEPPAPPIDAPPVVAPAPAVPAATPIPPELRAEIAAFKRQAGRQPRPALPAVPMVTTDDAAPVRQPPPTPGRHWPAVVVNVHVYEDDPARRFVYINGVKLREGDATPTGVTVERVLPDGVWLGYRGERFFQPR